MAGIYLVKEMISPKETQKSFRKKSSFMVVMLLLVIVFLFTSSLNSDIKIKGQVMNGSKIIPSDSLLEDRDYLTINKVRNPHEPMILIEDVGKFLTYFFITVALIIVPIFCIAYYIIYPRYTKKKAMKELEDTKQLDDSEKKNGPLADLLRLYDKKIVYNIICLGLIVFFVQNALALLIFTPVEIVEFQTSTIGGWIYYLWNIPLILDLIVGLIFTIGFLVAYCSTKNKKAIITSIFWILWMIFSIIYRVHLGMPSFKYLVDPSITDILNRMYLTSIFFAVSQVLFWFAIFMTDLSLRMPNQSILSRITWFGSINYLIGIPSALLLTIWCMPMDTDLAFFLGFGLVVPTFLIKVIIPPIVGMVSIFFLYRGIKKDYATNCI